MIRETDYGLVGDLGALDVECHLQQNTKMAIKVVYEKTTLYSTTYSYGWWTVDQHTGFIRKQVAEKLDGDAYPIDPDYWEDQWREFLTELNEFADEADDDALPKSVEAKRIIDATERVVVEPGETTEWRVVLEFGGRTGTLKFDQTDMSSGGPGALKEEFTRVFYTTPQIEEPEEWQDIRKRWQDEQEVLPAIEFTDEDIILESFVDDLRARITPVADPAQLSNGSETAWYDAENDRDVDGDAPILWVKRDAVEKVRTQLNEGIGPAALSKKLLTREYTVTKSQHLQVEGTKTRWWFFDPETLDIDESDVHETDDDDPQRTVEP